MEQFDVAILGAGPGGYVAAIRGAQLGAKVCVVEKEEVGGTCLNWGCIPTKTLIASVRGLEKIRDGRKHGLETKGEVIPRLDQMMARKDAVVQAQVKGIQSLFKSHGVALRYGKGRLLDPHTIEVAGPDGPTEKVTARKIIIATGSKPSPLPGLPIDGTRVLSSNEALALKDIPKSLLVIGAGAIGCEFASIFRPLGTEVSIVELLPHAVPMEDEEISQILERELKKQKVRLLVNTKVESIERKETAVVARLSDGQLLETEKILVSIGRAFNTEGIALEEIGLATGKRGEIPVNSKMETAVEGIYAIGDVTGKMMLAHVASRQGVVAMTNALGGVEEMDYSAVPVCIYSNPEIASVGLMEKEARESGIKTNVGLFQMRGLGMAHALGEISGLVKVVADAGSDRILGVHMIGAHVTEIIHEAVLAIHGGLTAAQWAKMIHAHPTISEALQEAVHDVHGAAIHLPPKEPPEGRKQ